MHILIMGGTKFVGRHVVEVALRRGHEVSIFNRGLQNPGLFPEVEQLKGDRNGDLESLRGRRFDAVIDTSAYRPAHVESLLAALAEPPSHYTLVSTQSVYASFPPRTSFDEQSAVLAGDEAYGALKARAEEVLLNSLPGRATIVRPGLIVGPHDPTGRFTYWPQRIAQGGRVLVPGRPDRPIQFIDARDLAEWLVHATEHTQVGVFNVACPAGSVTMAQLLEACLAETNSTAELHWVDDASITAAGIAPWTGLPLWLPEDDPQFGGFMHANSERAVAAGLRFRPVRQTVADTLAWSRQVAGETVSSDQVATLTDEREQELLGQLIGATAGASI
jgi:2'-hydroxyisoflavone reductase